MHKTVMVVTLPVCLMLCDLADGQQKTRRKTAPATSDEQALIELLQEMENELNRHLQRSDGSLIIPNMPTDREMDKFRAILDKELEQNINKLDGVGNTKRDPILSEREALVLDIEYARASDCRRLLAIHENIQRELQTVMTAIQSRLPMHILTGVQKANLQRLHRLKDILVDAQNRIMLDVRRVADNLQANINRVREIDKSPRDRALPPAHPTNPTKPTGSQELKTPSWGDTGEADKTTDTVSIPKMFGACFEEGL